jgi:hypothetical protein
MAGQAVENRFVGDAVDGKLKAGVGGQVLHVAKVTCGQIVDDGYPVASRKQGTAQVASNETGTTCNQKVSHLSSFPTLADGVWVLHATILAPLGGQKVTKMLEIHKKGHCLALTNTRRATTASVSVHGP